MIISVTEDDIKMGKVGDCQFCPVALAVKRNTARPITVGSDILDVDQVSHWLPLEVVDFIEDFDSGLLVDPFTFELPDEFLL
jgi:hypothetical protein